MKKLLGPGAVALPRNRNESTRIKLIEAAEELFARDGLDSVTFAQICEAAGQKNNMSVQYHFGDKVGLFYAICEFRERQLDELRVRMLHLARTQDRLGDIRSLLDILYRPMYDLFVSAGESAYINLTALYLMHYRPRGMVHSMDPRIASDGCFREVWNILEARLANLGTVRFNMRMEALASMFFGTFVQRLECGEASLLGSEQFSDTIEMMASALCAPVLTPA
jgi:AcrR family transcriptional regulator